MTRFLKIASVTAITLSMLAAPVYAQQRGGVKVSGFTAVTTVANNAANVALLGGKAKQKIGGIHGNVEASGFTAVTTVANNAANVALLGGKACQTIGGISSDTEC